MSGLSSPASPEADAVVVGAGISGIACATPLVTAGRVVRVLDRGRVIGGRMASRRLRETGTAWDGRVVDYGASYFTARHPDFVAVVDGLIAQGIVRPWTDAFHVADPDGVLGLRAGPMRYAAPGGLRSVVEHLAQSAQVVVESPVQVRSVRIADDRPSVVDVDGTAARSAALCMPEPQADRLLSPRQPARVGPSTTWEPVIAVTMVFAERCWMEFDGMFVNDSPVLQWIADDGSRRGDAAPVLVAHVNPVLAAHHLEDPDSVTAPAIAALRRILGIRDLPVWAWAHRWSLARPRASTAEDFGRLENGPVALAGDAFAGGPRVEAAWLSGRAAGNWLAELTAR